MHTDAARGGATRQSRRHKERNVAEAVSQGTKPSRGYDAGNLW
jgi:hypothetical protein